MKPQSSSLLQRSAWALLCVFVFSLPLEKVLMVPGVGTISQALGLVAFAAGAATVAQRRAARLPNAGLLLAASFLLWSGLTYFWSLSGQATAARLATLAQLFTMLWLVWELCRTPAAQLWLMHAYVSGAAVSSVLTMIRYARSQQTYYRRYATAGFDPNDLGITLALAIPMALYLSSRVPARAAWLVRPATALIIAAILLTASRTALVAACLGFAFALLTWRGAALAPRIASVALLLLLVLGAIRLAPPASRERLATLPAELARGTLHNRTQIWKAGLKAFKRHWLAGVGAGAYPEAVRPWLGRPAVPGHEYTAHNTFLSVAVETGVVGLLVFGLLLATLVLFTWVLAPAERALWYTALAVWTAGVLTLTWENRKPTWLLFALILTAWAHAFRPREEGS